MNTEIEIRALPTSDHHAITLLGVRDDLEFSFIEDFADRLFPEKAKKLLFKPAMEGRDSNATELTNFSDKLMEYINCRIEYQASSRSSAWYDFAREEDPLLPGLETLPRSSFPSKQKIVYYSAIPITETEKDRNLNAVLSARKELESYINDPRRDKHRKQLLWMVERVEQNIDSRLRQYMPEKFGGSPGAAT